MRTLHLLLVSPPPHTPPNLAPPHLTAPQSSPEPKRGRGKVIKNVNRSFESGISARVFLQSVLNQKVLGVCSQCSRSWVKGSDMVGGLWLVSRGSKVESVFKKVPACCHVCSRLPHISNLLITRWPQPPGPAFKTPALQATSTALHLGLCFWDVHL